MLNAICPTGPSRRVRVIGVGVLLLARAKARSIESIHSPGRYTVFKPTITLS